MVDESDFKAGKRQRLKPIEKEFTLVNANGIMMKCYVGGNAYTSVQPRSSRDSSQDSSVTSSSRPTFVIKQDEDQPDRSIERSKVQFRMSKYWNYRVRQDFSPKPRQRKQDALALKIEVSKTPVTRKFNLVKLSDL